MVPYTIVTSISA